MKLKRDPGFDFAAGEVDAVLITGSENVRYLTGYTGTNGLTLIPRDREPVFFTDPRYAIQSSQEVSCRTKVIAKGGLLAGAAKELVRIKARRLGFERAHFSFERYTNLVSLLPPHFELVPLDDFVAERRMVKDADELSAIRESVLINSRAFDRAVKKFRPGMSESNLAAEIEYQMRRLGAEKPAFETIVAAGERTALPHAQPGARPIGSNELLLIDMGAFRRGYASDMTRTLHVGRPSAKVRKMYAAVLEAQLAGIDAIREGVTAGHVDRVTRKTLRKHGLDKAFTHSTGHGLGLEIHEAPRLGRGDVTRLRAGMAVTVEPGVYIEGLGGIRIEDTVVVTRSGCEVLTPTTKELVAI